MASSSKVKDVMTYEPITVSPDTPFKELVDLMIHHDIGAVPVIGADGILEGIVSETDLLAKPAFGDEHPKTRTKIHAFLSGEQRWLNKAPGLIAAEIMTTPVLTIRPQDPLALAARQLVAHRIGRLAVVDEGRLVGIVSRRDLLRPFDRPDEEITTDAQAALDDPVAFEQGHQITLSVQDGVVTLTGTVGYPHEVSLAHDLVANVAGVVRVESDIAATLPDPTPPPSPDPPISSVSRDT